MPSQNIHVVSEVGTLEEAFEALAKFQKLMKYLINGNIDFENIRARSIKADNIEAGTLTAQEIAANTITADKMLVDELSAITAKLGKIISGELYSAYIATSESGYPRVVIDPTGNYIGIYTSASAYMEIKPGITGGPTVTGYEGGDLKYILGTIFGIPNYQSIDSLDIRAGSSLTLACGTGAFDNVKIPSWGKLYSIGDGQTLADALHNLATAIEGAAKSGVSTGSSGGHNHGIPDGTKLMVNGGGTVTWSVAGSHTHAQS